MIAIARVLRVWLLLAGLAPALVHRVLDAAVGLTQPDVGRADDALAGVDEVDVHGAQVEPARRRAAEVAPREHRDAAVGFAGRGSEATMRPVAAARALLHPVLVRAREVVVEALERRRGLLAVQEVVDLQRTAGIVSPRRPYRQTAPLGRAPAQQRPPHNRAHAWQSPPAAPLRPDGRSPMRSRAPAQRHAVSKASAMDRSAMIRPLAQVGWNAR